MTKYNAVRTTIDGITFDSKAEAARYLELKMMLNNGDIQSLKLQVPYEIVINGKKICKYYADFRYVDKDGFLITEDVKGVRTAVYRLKKKLVEAVYGIEIQEVKQ